jgi:hypothetical protein
MHGNKKSGVDMDQPGRLADKVRGNRNPLKLHKLPTYNLNRDFDNGRNDDGTNANPGCSGKPSNHDFLYVLFPVLTGNSGFIMTG